MPSLLLLLAATAAAQRPRPPIAPDAEPAPDRVELRNGRELAGRVAQRYRSELLLLQDGKRVRVPMRQVAAIETRRDRVAEWLELRERAPRRPSALWTLAEWAREHGLPRLARLQALEFVLTTPAGPEPPAAPVAERLERAHRMLGHRRRGSDGPWLWPVDRGDDAGWVTLERWISGSTEHVDALELSSTHFTCRSSGGPLPTIAALFDLERLYVWLHEQYGEVLYLQEVGEPIDLRIWGSGDEFPDWIVGAGVEPDHRAYYVPHPFGDAVFTFFPPARAGAHVERPAGLFSFATQALLYRALAGDPSVGARRARLAAWAEIGFGEWIASRIVDPTPGHVVFGAAVRDPAAVALALRARRMYGIEDLIHFNLRDHFYNGLTDKGAIFWADVHMLVAYLMADDTLRPRFLEYLRVALGEGKGNSSSLLDKILGRKIETVEPGWIAWLRSI